MVLGADGVDRHKLRDYTQNEKAQAFLAEAEELGRDIVSQARTSERLLVVHHSSDVDGRTSGVIAEEIGTMLGLEVETLGVPQLSNTEISQLSETIDDYNPDLIIFTDIGSGYKRLLDEAEIDKCGADVYIFDHHPPMGPDSTFKELNPANFGMDGGESCSGATIAYSLAESVYDALPARKQNAYKKDLEGRNIEFHNPNEPVMNVLGSAAMIGARVDGTSPNGEVNATVFKKATDEQLVTPISWPFYGYHRRNIVTSLAGSDRPVLEGISGDDKGAREFAKELGLHTTYTPARMSKGERDLVLGSISELIEQSGASEAFQKYQQSQLFERSYVLGEFGDTEIGTLSEFGSMLTACTKFGATPEEKEANRELAKKVLLGERGEVLEKADEVWHRYRLLLRDGLVKTFGKIKFDAFHKDEIELKDGENHYISSTFYYKDADQSTMGVMASMALGTANFKEEAFRKLPIIAYTYVKGDTDEESFFKFSGRSFNYLTGAGLDIGEAMNTAAESVGGIGGGHAVAAGASIPRAGWKDFLTVLNKTIGEQLEDYILNGYKLLPEHEEALLKDTEFDPRMPSFFQTSGAWSQTLTKGNVAYALETSNGTQLGAKKGMYQLLATRDDEHVDSHFTAYNTFRDPVIVSAKGQFDAKADYTGWAEKIGEDGRAGLEATIEQGVYNALETKGYKVERDGTSTKLVSPGQNKYTLDAQLSEGYCRVNLDELQTDDKQLTQDVAVMMREVRDSYRSAVKDAYNGPLFASYQLEALEAPGDAPPVEA
ncbi:MAG: DHHA1 domain-containing protein [Candidatus Undinarchaeales archaeon]|jgi:RecJ-like exonuclease|nr:DHHA1 domain-containing protein [Candidatus Undinarchaeales archaeon]